MNRTISSYLDQRTTNLLDNLRVKRFRAHIIDVLFPAHSFVVTASGYSGPAEVQADPLINFGTYARPLVFRGNDVWIQMDENGHWHAVEYIPTNRCVPVSDPNPPNVPLPTYRPPIDTNTIDFGGYSPVDMTFTPSNISMGQLPISKMPLSGSSNIYDIADGIATTVAANSSKVLLYTIAPRRFKITSVSLSSDVSGVTLFLYIAGATTRINSVNNNGAWTITCFDQNGVFLSSHIGGAGNTLTYYALPVSSVVDVPVGATIKTELATGGNACSLFAYGFGGKTY